MFFIIDISLNKFIADNLFSIYAYNFFLLLIGCWNQSLLNEEKNPISCLTYYY